MQSTEEWRPVVGYEGFYEVSDRGRVRSVDRVIDTATGPQRHRGVILRPCVRKERVQVVLAKGSGGVTRLVHHLVLESFVGPRPAGLEGCHNNGNATDNSPSNLRWDTHTENMGDMKIHGTSYWRNKSQCPRGHALEHPNLAAWALRAGRRTCLACAKARDYAKHHKTVFSNEKADEYYAGIRSGIRDFR